MEGVLKIMARVEREWFLGTMARIYKWEKSSTYMEL